MPISVLVTGFSVFPGAATNPSEALIGWLAARRPAFGSDVAMHYALLDTAFATIREQLAALGGASRPDIAIHFGLARQAQGFRLERIARNRVSTTSPDMHGLMSELDRVCPNGADLPSALPLARIAAGLGAAGLPCEFSEDAGDYLCNFCFYLSCGRLAAPLAPTTAGFVHVPHLAQGEEERGEMRLTADELWRGAMIVIGATIAAHRDRIAA